MQRRDFLTRAIAASAITPALVPALASGAEPAPATAQPAGILAGSPVLGGPAPESLAVLQPVTGPATGYLELAIGDQDFQRVDVEAAGLLPYAPHVLKFELPPLPAGSRIRYRTVVTPIDFKTAYKITRGETITSATFETKTLDPSASETRFMVWNDTHENLTTIKPLHQATNQFVPDFLLWNGDQTNDVYDPAKMTNQYLAPGGLEISARWPLAYVRGNHDVRGPAARHLPEFTGTPGNRYYYAFRSGPMAALVLDTGEDKVDEHPVFGGLAAFEAMRQKQKVWLAETIRQPWFREAPVRVLFCHIPLFWKDDKQSAEGPWTFSQVCRDAWLPELVEGKIQLIISGHTHQSAWLPATADQPIPQLIGGGPQPARATYIEGHAKGNALNLTMKNLEGEVLHQISLS